MVKLPAIVPSGRRWRTASDRSTSPPNVPLMTGRSGTWTELLPGALMTTSKVPLTGPHPVTVDTLSVPVAMTVQLWIRRTETRSSAGHRGVPTSANPWSGEVALRRIIPAELGSGSKVTRSLISYSVTPVAPSESKSPARLTPASPGSDTASPASIQKYFTMPGSSSKSIQSGLRRKMKVQRPYQCREYSGVLREQTLGFMARTVRTISDQFLAGHSVHPITLGRSSDVARRVEG